MLSFLPLDELYAGLNVADFIQGSRKQIGALIARNQMNSLYYLVAMFPSLLEGSPVLNMFVQSGVLHFELYILAAGPDRQSKLSHEVRHTFAHDNHMLALHWGAELKSLGETLVFLSRAQRSADVE